MRSLLMWAARAAGVLGVAAMLLAFGARLSGSYWVGGLQAGTLLQAGIAAMVAACLAYLAVLVEPRR